MTNHRINTYSIIVISQSQFSNDYNCTKSVVPVPSSTGPCTGRPDKNCHLFPRQDKNVCHMYVNNRGRQQQWIKHGSTAKPRPTTTRPECFRVELARKPTAKARLLGAVGVVGEGMYSGKEK